MKKLLFILLPIMAIAAGLAWFVTRTPASPFDGVAVDEAPSADVLAHGEYVARLADCVACHSTRERAPFAGGLEMATPLGSIYSTNITPDAEAGIGGYSLAEFDRAVRMGVARDGRRLYPAMPFPSYVKLTDDDVCALYAYFTHGVEPASVVNEKSDIPWPLNLRWPIALWGAVFSPSGVYEAKAAQDELWNRGAYLVQGPGHCGSCHTPRGPAFQEKALDDGSALFLSGAVLDGWFAPSLRADHNLGLGRWSEEDIYEFLKTGRNEHAVVFGSMADAFNNSTQFMTDDDLRAIAHYLKSLPGNPERDGAPWDYNPSSNDALSAGKVGDTPGAQTYVAKCSYCHGADGRGQGRWIPPLAGSASSLAPDGVSSINVTLNGSARVVAAGVPDAYRMPPFRNQLSDKEIADVLSFIRTGWGNEGGAVTAEEVKNLRDRTDPASSQVIVLQMR